MNAEMMIDALDRALAISGQDVKLRRNTGTVQMGYSVDIRACIMDYGSDEIVGSIKQGDRKVVTSPTQMIDKQWPWPPKRNDKVIVDEKQFNIESVDNEVRDSQLVRINMQVRG